MFPTLPNKDTSFPSLSVNKVAKNSNSIWNNSNSTIKSSVGVDIINLESKKKSEEKKMLDKLKDFEEESDFEDDEFFDEDDF